MKNKLFAMFGVGALFFGSALYADVKPANIITDNMVLQKGMPVRIWGTADAGEKVSVKFMKSSGSTVAGKDGKWRVDLKAPKKYVSDGQELVIQGKNKIVLKNVVVGEVWLGSGQSNMEYHIRHVKNTEQYIKENGVPNVRYFRVPANGSEEPIGMHDLPPESKWEKFDAENFKANREMSIILTFFGKRLNEELDGNPIIGLINTSFGGANLETWVSKETFSEAGLTGEFERITKMVKGWHDNDVRKYDALPDAERAKKRDPRTKPNWESRPANSYNAMVAPIVPYPFKGMLWYQGEMNSGMDLYLKEFPFYVGMMRKIFENPNMPIYTVQLPDYKEKNWPKTRDVQRKLADIVENSDVAVTIDGHEIDLHPQDKTMVTDRLARLALVHTYGKKDIVASSPRPEKVSLDGKSVKVQFKNCYKGLKLKDGAEVRNFEVAGKDGKFVEAKAKIASKNVVEVEVPSEISEPAKVRYAWAADPDVNLYNSGDLPASPFEEDIQK